MLRPNHVKQIIYVIIAVLLLAAVSFIIFRFVLPEERAIMDKTLERITGRLPFRSSVRTPGMDEDGLHPKTPSGEDSLGAPEQKLVQITDFAVVSPALDRGEEKILFYEKNGGDLLSTDFNGESREKISNLTIVGLMEILWSPLKDRRAVRYVSGDEVKTFLHIATSGVAVLPNSIKSFSWSPDGKSLAYLLPREGGLDLVTANQDGKNPKTVFHAPLLGANLYWVSADRIILETPPSGFAEGYVFVFSRSQGTLNKVLGPLYGLTSRWSPDGSRVLVGSTNAAGRNSVLSVRDSSGKEFYALPVQTLPEKCAWYDNKELYCALPRNIPAATVLPDEYLSGEFNSSDRLIKIDAEKNSFEDVPAEGNFDASDLVISPKRDYLFFVNRRDGTLWSLGLK